MAVAAPAAMLPVVLLLTGSMAFAGQEVETGIGGAAIAGEGLPALGLAAAGIALIGAMLATLMRMPRGRLFRIALVLLLASGGAAAVWLSGPVGLVAAMVRSGAVEQTADGPEPDAPRGVRVAVVALEPEVADRRYTGTIVARYEAPVAFRVGGKIVARRVEVGQEVQAGDILMQLDPVDLDASVAAAEASVAALRAQAVQVGADESRARQLLAKGWVAQAAYDRALAARRALEGQIRAGDEQVRLARNARDYATLRAPYAGLVTAVMGEAGQVVGGGEPVVVLVRPGDREAEVAIPEGQEADLAAWSGTLEPWSDPGGRHPVTLRELAPEADLASRTFRARYSVSGDPPALGTTVTLHLGLTGTEPVARLPATALSYRQGRPVVWVVTAAGDRVRPVEVAVRALGNDAVTVTGLQDGMQVVTLGVHRLDEGLPVRVAEVERQGS